ncbi:SDR family NAD(P)-dependent oxidoreductase [Galbitalea soli]|uniref:SDR family NAD(P)-dependent oxidoreductase n=1 Tax=Galbitalea soli TaxID=1268042 RepID=A0A7C9PND3_9MICO|nr:SDR family NAD(P)-dependent oxidoreductase [Galbitalea soli]NEM91446.1 SDR family NAD(P)-dependent oxidoreductase [Galbitalea soli]NYJ30139.1 NAD(P)-dependent dehydrogenase (short-subunit alcohol dehydrogenase family) [Galbitalea soli]
MPGRTIIITGASDGIGAAAARALSAAGERVVLVGRSAAKTDAMARELNADHFVADFARLDDVRALAAGLLAAYPRIDVLANNAGGIMGERELTVDGLEKTLQVNHLAPYLLTRLLMDRLVESRASVIATSSAAAASFGRIDLADLGNERRYTPTKAYGDAKLHNILFTRELDYRYRDAGISAAAFHPGVIATNFAAESTTFMRRMYTTALRRLLGSPATGADTLVWLATTTPGVDWPQGEYFVKRAIARSSRQAYDLPLAHADWEASARLVGLEP